MNYTSKQLIEIDKNNYLQTFKRFPIVLSEGKGAKVWDIEGREYIDALGGIAVSTLGHQHPALVNAIQEQAKKMLHISNFYLSEPQALLSEKLTKLSKLERVFFTNSGAESVEGAIKIARKYAHSIGRGGEIISFESSFHGRTLATIATGKKQMQQGFEPIPEGFKQVKFNDIESVKKGISKDTAAIIIEPIQGEGGINVASQEFLSQLREICDRENIVLIFDEIQCGIGRTGKMFAKEHYQIQPDIMTLAKALGGGVPIGAILSSQKVSDAMDYGDHGTTFGGNPLACKAALTVLETIQKENILEEVSHKSDYLIKQIKKLNIPEIKEIRGKGLMIGIDFEFETKELVNIMLSKGVLANATANTVLRLVPPLIISKTEIDQIIQAINESYQEFKKNV